MHSSRTSESESTSYGGIFDYEEKKNRLEIVNAALEAPDIWNDPENAQSLGKEKKNARRSGPWH